MSSMYLSGERANFHTHTYRCKHAVGTVRDYCQAAVEQGVTTLGFSEHVPFTSEEMNIKYRRIDPKELPEYCQDVRAAKIEFPELQLFTGMELEYEKDYFASYYPELKERLNLDYMIGAVHYFYGDDGVMRPFWVPDLVLDYNDYRRIMENIIMITAVLWKTVSILWKPDFFYIWRIRTHSPVFIPIGQKSLKRSPVICWRVRKP